MLTHATLNQFSGTEDYFFNPMFAKIRYTDGVKYVSDNGAAWLVTDALAVLAHHEKVRVEEFVAIKVKSANGAATVTYDDGNDNVLYVQQYPVTDLPAGEIKFFYTDTVLMLAGEY
jgi:hypothetical protein